MFILSLIKKCFLKFVFKESTFTFYSQYFTVLKEVNNKDGSTGKNKWKRRLRIAQGVLLYGALHACVLALFQNQLSKLANILFFNNIYIVGFAAAWNYILGAFSLLGALLYELMYIKNVGLSAAILYGILIKQSNEAFLWRYRAPVREVWKAFGYGKNNGGQYKLESNAHFVQWVAVYVRVALQGTLLLIGKYFGFLGFKLGLFNYFFA